MLGARQKGRSDLQLASLRRDRDLVDARPGPGRRRSSAPTRPSPGNPLLADELRIFVDDDEAEYLLRS